jgi:hypothetical protein
MESVPEYSESRHLRAACRMVQAFPFVASACGVVSLAALFWSSSTSLRPIAGLGLAVILIWAAAIALIEGTLRCDACKRRFMIEGFGEKHPGAHRREVSGGAVALSGIGYRGAQNTRLQLTAPGRCG